MNNVFSNFKESDFMLSKHILDKRSYFLFVYLPIFFGLVSNLFTIDVLFFSLFNFNFSIFMIIINLFLFVLFAPNMGIIARSRNLSEIFLHLDCLIYLIIWKFKNRKVLFSCDINLGELTIFMKSSHELIKEHEKLIKNPIPSKVLTGMIIYSKVFKF